MDLNRVRSDMKLQRLSLNFPSNSEEKILFFGFVFEASFAIDEWKNPSVISVGDASDYFFGTIGQKHDPLHSLDFPSVQSHTLDSSHRIKISAPKIVHWLKSSGKRIT
jgi:hypothetical protein